MWQIEPATGWERDQNHYAKKRPKELAAVMRNLDRYIRLFERAEELENIAGC